MRRVTYRVPLLMVVALLLAACGDVDDTRTVTPTGTDESAAAEETAPAAPEAELTPTESEVTTPGPANGDETGNAPTPDPEEIEEWLETALTFQGIAQGPDGELYVGYPPHAALLVLSPDGELTDAWGEEVRSPSDIEVDDEGTVHVTDFGGVRKYNPDGAYLGRVSEFGFEEGQFVEPHSLAFGGDGSLFVSDESRVRIIRYSPDGEFVDEWAEREGNVAGPAPLLATSPDGNFYALSPVAGSRPSPMQKRSTDLEVVDEWDVPIIEQANAALDDPLVDDDLLALSVAIDNGPDDRLYILSALVASGPDAPEHGIIDLQVLVHEPDGELVDAWHAAADNGLEDPLPQPGGMTVTGDGEVIIVDSTPQTHRILRFATDGEFLGTWEPDVPAFLCDLDPDAFQGLTCE